MWGFVEFNRRAEVRSGDYSWVRNTLVCLETDLADAVLAERSVY